MSTEKPDRPFAQAVDLRRHVDLATNERLVQELEQSVRDGDGLTVVTGPSGVGKSHLAVLLASRLDSACGGQRDVTDGSVEQEASATESTKQFRSVILQPAGLSTRRALLQAALHDLNVDYQGLTEQESRLRLLDTARKQIEDQAPLVLAIDEADRFPARILEDLRSLTNFVQDGEPLFRVVLFGSPDLEEHLSGSELEAVNQRVVCQLNMVSLGRDESARYVDGRLETAGLKTNNVFTNAAIDEICEIAAGLPRAINLLAERSIELFDRRVTVNAPDGSGTESNNWLDETSFHETGDTNRVSRKDVLSALDALEALPIEWRRPFEPHGDSEWMERRRDDDLPALEPLDGAVVEIGANPIELVNPPASTEEPTDSVVPEIDSGAVPSPLRRMHEILGDELDDQFAELAGLADQLAGDDMPPPNDERIAEDCSEDQADLEPLGNEAATFETGSPSADAIQPSADEVEPSAEAIQPEIALGVEERRPDSGDQSADTPQRDSKISVPVDSDEAEVVAESLPEFCDPPPSPEDVEDATTDYEHVGSMIDSIFEETRDAAQGIDALQDAIERGDSATRIVDAVMPLLEDDQANDEDIEALRALLTQPRPGSDASPHSGDEAQVGGDALNLAAELNSVVSRDAPNPERDARVHDAPYFAFDEPGETSHAITESDLDEPLVPQAVGASAHLESGYPVRPAADTQPAAQRRLGRLFTRIRKDRRPSN